jgi:hypothetical protein
MHCTHLRHQVLGLSAKLQARMIKLSGWKVRSYMYEHSSLPKSFINAYQKTEETKMDIPQRSPHDTK